jgi:hypothetical protein
MYYFGLDVRKPCDFDVLHDYAFLSTALMVVVRLCYPSDVEKP